MFMETKVYWNRLLERLRNELDGVTQNVTTPLAFNLRMLAAISDAEQVYQCMQSLYRKWCTELPFIGDEGMEVDWVEVSSMYQEAFADFREIGAEMEYPNTYVSLAPPKELKGWRQWDREASFRREEGEEKDLNSPDYARFLQPSCKKNVWCFVANELSTPTNSQPSLRSMLRNYSLANSEELQEALRRIYQKIHKTAQAIDLLLCRPQKVIKEREALDGLMKDFFVRLVRKYSPHTGHGIAYAIVREYEEWLEEHSNSVSESLLLMKEEECWQRLLKSHFLDDLMCTHGNQEYEPARTQEIVDEMLFCKNVSAEIREEQQAMAIGRYIYRYQLEYKDWAGRTKAFLRYFIFRERIAELRIQQAKKNLALNEQELKIRGCILKLLSEKDKEGKPMMQQQSYWFVIYRILVDYYGWDKNLKSFCDAMKRWNVADGTPPCSYESLKKVNPFFSVRAFDSWKVDKYDGSKAIFYKMHTVAKRFKEFLEVEMG